MPDLAEALDGWQRERDLARVQHLARVDGILRMRGSDVVGVVDPDDLAARFEVIRSERDYLMATDSANATALAALARVLREHLAAN